MDTKKEAILAALDKFVAQRAGIEPGNYGSWKDYRAESRSVTKDLHHYRELRRYVAWHDSITGDMLAAAFRDAYSGRLTCVLRDSGAVELEYCTGQYSPTEYRRAACAVLASAVWSWFRDCLPPVDSMSRGDRIRHMASKEMPRAIADRYFDARG